MPCVLFPGGSNLAETNAERGEHLMHNKINFGKVEFSQRNPLTRRDLDWLAQSQLRDWGSKLRLELAESLTEVSLEMVGFVRRGASFAGELFETKRSSPGDGSREKSEPVPGLR